MVTSETANLELPDPTLAEGAPDIDWPLDHPRAINDILALLDSTFLDAELQGRPTHYDIAVSVVCNIKCPFCPRQTFGPEIKSGLLKEKHFAPVLDHLECSHRTGLYGLGEPFLNKSFFDYLAAAKARGTYCMTSSHGMSLTPEAITKVLDSGLDELCVSMDGADARTFNFLRSGADFDTVIHNVGSLIRQRNARGSKLPRVHIASAISKYNVWQMKKLVRMAHGLGADKIAFSNLVLDFPEHMHASIVGTRVFQWNLSRARREAERLGIECVYFFQMPFPWREEQAPPPRGGVRYGCPSAWRQLIIERDGNVKPCCYLDYSLGNTESQPLPEAFNGKAAKALRQSFIDGEYFDKCKGCGQFTEIGPETTAGILREAERRISAGKFSDPVRARLRDALERFQSLAACK